MPGGDVNAAAETPEVEGIVPSQWYLDLKVENQLLRAEVERLQAAFNAEVRVHGGTLKARYSAERERGDLRAEVEQLRAEKENLLAEQAKLASERDAARYDGEFGFSLVALLLEELAGLRVEKQQLSEENEELRASVMYRQREAQRLQEALRKIAENDMPKKPLPQDPRYFVFQTPRDIARAALTTGEDEG